MQITVPSGGHFLITSKGQHIPLGARVDAVFDGLRYTNAILGAITVGIESPRNNKLELQEIGLWADDFTERQYDESEEYRWSKWDGGYETISFIEGYDVIEITLHTIDSDAATLYKLTANGLSQDEFLDRFMRLVAKAAKEIR